MIELKDLNYFYGETQVLFDVSLQAKKGEIVVLLGPSGAGKSSLLRILNILERPKEGKLEIAGFEFDFSQSISEKTIRDLRQKVGMIFQQYHLWPHRTVLQNLTYAPVKLGKMSLEEAKKRGVEALHSLKLEGLEDRYPLKLSGGQQQRVAIARALMMDPDVLLFDEPTAALDPEITSQVATIIEELAQTGITQIVVTHDVDFAKRIATYVVYMEQGKVVEEGDASIFVSPKTEEFKQYLSH
ncbi:arginine ABC transporter ATP-binding protein ArtP [Ignatzschineria ureiclastica]|uniref:Arginine transport ATP-binding protein ArtP n=1 Tax=Ignatzschineria ureiclastica TaxID=472582 RepID=A0A2U2AG60_9GAMM|nr:arginine ABC transporter ATP-binding protein ArtP [Ignatzschineria ureiclastica]PWD81646.1 arginine ABC transporter ATP-binding protein ArtP [Ignatzschineria ureiclastica]GGZ89565.1 arginine transport ATP-binding protein ArtP [Ignatzschineria ureiclastica]